jgi:hypothetical protein
MARSRRHRGAEAVNGWLCLCGNWVEGNCHCGLCLQEAPWGCDCGAQDEDDEDDLEGLDIDW